MSRPAPLPFHLPLPDIAPWRAGNTGAEGVCRRDQVKPFTRHALVPQPFGGTRDDQSSPHLAPDALTRLGLHLRHLQVAIVDVTFLAEIQHRLGDRMFGLSFQGRQTGQITADLTR